MSTNAAFIIVLVLLVIAGALNGVDYWKKDSEAMRFISWVFIAIAIAICVIELTV